MPKSNHKPYPSKEMQGPETEGQYLGSMPGKLDQAQGSVNRTMEQLKEIEAKAMELQNYNQNVRAQAPQGWKNSDQINAYNEKVLNAPNYSVDKFGYAIQNPKEIKRMMPHIQIQNQAMNKAASMLNKSDEAIGGEDYHEDAVTQEDALNKIRQQLAIEKLTKGM